MKCLEPNEQERKYFSGLGTHKIRMHPFGTKLSWTLMCLSFGTCAQPLLLGPLQIPEFLYLAPFPISLFVFITWTFSPCCCASSHLLNRRGRNLVNKKIGYWVRQFIVRFAFLSLFFFTPGIALLLAFGEKAVDVYLYFLSVTTSIYALCIFVFEKREFSPEYLVVEDHWKCADESDLCEENLQKLVSLLIDAGRFDDAEIYSKKLLAMAEAGRPGLCS